MLTPETNAPLQIEHDINFDFRLNAFAAGDAFCFLRYCWLVAIVACQWPIGKAFPPFISGPVHGRRPIVSFTRTPDGWGLMMPTVWNWERAGCSGFSATPSFAAGTSNERSRAHLIRNSIGIQTGSDPVCGIHGVFLEADGGANTGILFPRIRTNMVLARRRHSYRQSFAGLSHDDRAF